MKWIVEAESIDDVVLGRYAICDTPLIECKDCKHYKAYYYTGCLACHLLEGRTVRRDLDDFCSRAERITNEID